MKSAQWIYIGIQALNTSKDIFGLDAECFRPERWLDGQLDKLLQSKGLTAPGGTLSFLAGPRSCIGYKFAILEVKVGDRSRHLEMLFSLRELLIDYTCDSHRFLRIRRARRGRNNIL